MVANYLKESPTRMPGIMADGRIMEINWMIDLSILSSVTNGMARRMISVNMMRLANT